MFKHSLETIEGQINQLSQGSFIKLLDVVMDLDEVLELASSKEIEIPVIPLIIKFPRLLPIESERAYRQYGAYRKHALEFLKGNSIVLDYTCSHETHPILGVFRAKVNRKRFEELFKPLMIRAQGWVGAKGNMEQLTFNLDTGDVCLGKKSIRVRTNTLAFFICQKAFQNRGEWVKDINLIDSWGKDGTKTSIYDAQRNLNNILNKFFDLKPFEYDRSNERIRIKIK